MTDTSLMPVRTLNLVVPLAHKATALHRLAHMPEADTHQAGNSYLGLVRQATHSHQERAAVCRVLLQRGHPVEGKHLTKALHRVRSATNFIATSAGSASA